MKWLCALLVLWELQFAVCADNRKWCPPANFQSDRALRPNTTRVSLLTDIHGQLVRTGIRWGIFMDGQELSRFLFHYIGSLGFDKAYINVLYNATIHVTPPTIEEIYPSSRSCVAEWAKIGAVDWFPYKYLGPQEEWVRDPYSKKPTAQKNLYKAGRGISPRFNEIKAKNEADWLFVLDVDEYLIPINFHPKVDSWCDHTHPSLISQGLEQMEVAVRNNNDCTADMKKLFNVSCANVASFAFPIYLWTNSQDAKKRTDIMPSIRTRTITPYDAHLIQRHNMTGDRDTSYAWWKSIHRLAISPDMPKLAPTVVMHFNPGVAIKSRSPTKESNVLSFDLAHYRKVDDRFYPYMVRDDRLENLVTSFNKCMALLSKGKK